MRDFMDVYKLVWLEYIVLGIEIVSEIFFLNKMEGKY